MTENQDCRKTPLPKGLSLTFIPYILSTKDLRFDAFRARRMLSGLIIPAIWRAR